MSKLTLSSYIRDDLEGLESKNEPGPYITISRQLGCDGYGLGQLLVEKLNALAQKDETKDQKQWRLYKKEILKQLAEETGLTEDVIEKERLARPSLLKDFLRGVRKSSIPDGYEIRNKITILVRTVAFEGHAVIVGQSGTSATADLENGISVRVEAPKNWRIAKISKRENLDRNAAIAKIEKVEKQRVALRKIYEQKNPKTPVFNLQFDNTVFTTEQIADQIILAMQQKNLVSKE